MWCSWRRSAADKRGLSMRPIAFVCFAWVWLVAAPARAAESEKLETATVIVQGKVRTIFREEGENDGPLVRILVEVVVEKVEKAKPGDGLRPGKVLHVWTHRAGPFHSLKIVTPMRRNAPSA